uniref:Uncharacterized protein n=1 Tax=Cannabis sativa TaxID=3483 RepID=A0A803PQG4_CANSA
MASKLGWAHVEVEHTFPSEATLLAYVLEVGLTLSSLSHITSLRWASIPLKKHPNVARPTGTSEALHDLGAGVNIYISIKEEPNSIVGLLYCGKVDLIAPYESVEPHNYPKIRSDRIVFKEAITEIMARENKVTLKPKALDPTQTLIPMGDDDNEDVDGLVFPTKMVEENTKEARPTRPHDFRLPDSKQTHQSSTKGVVLHVTVLLATLSLPIKPTTLNEEYLAKHQEASQIFIERDDDTSTKAKETSKMIFARRKEGQGARSLTHFLTLARTATAEWIRQHSAKTWLNFPLTSYNKRVLPLAK